MLVRFTRLWSLVLVSLLAAAPASHAQTVTYDSGSIYDLDPPARQSTGPEGQIFEQIVSSRAAHRMQEVRDLGRGDILRKLARPVGRLAIGLPGGKISFCTASLVADDLVLTNHHCIPGLGTHGAVTEAMLWMGYLNPASLEGVAQYPVDTKPVEADKALDYALLRVRGRPGGLWGKVTLQAAEPEAGGTLFIVHHPGGATQHITRGGCQAGDPATIGDDIRHICDTLQGSSGAPIFDNNTRAVIGLHNRAAGPGVNAGKRIASLRKASPTLARLMAVEEAPRTVAPAAPTASQAPLSPAATEWQAVQGTTSCEVLTTYLESHGASPFARYAAARRKELKCGEQKVAVGTFPTGGQAPSAVVADEQTSGLEALRLVPQVGHSSSLFDVEVSPDGKILASAAADHTVKLWDVASGDLIRTLGGHSGFVRSIAFSPDGQTLAAASHDAGFNYVERRRSPGHVTLWNVANGQVVYRLPIGKDGMSVAFSPDGRTLASGSVDEYVRLWDASSGELLRSIKGKEYNYAVAFSPDGQTLASGSHDGTVNLWNPENGKLRRSLLGRSGGVWSLAFSPDGGSLATAEEEKTIKIWSLQNGRVLRTLKGHSAHVSSVAWSPDGRLLASSDQDQNTYLWNARTGKRAATVVTNSVASVAFTPDSKTLATGSWNPYTSDIKLWDVGSRRVLRTMVGHNSNIESVAFAPDGRTLATGSTDKTVKLWDIMSGRQVQNLKGHQDEVTALAFSADASTLHVREGDIVYAWNQWDLNTGRLKSVAVRTDEGENGPVSTQSNIRAEPMSSAVHLVGPDGKLIARFATLTDGEWVAYRPEGPFTVSSDAALEHLRLTPDDRLESLPLSPAYIAAYRRDSLELLDDQGRPQKVKK